MDEPSEALAAVFTVYRLSRINGLSPLTSLLLTGYAVGSLLAAVRLVIGGRPRPVPACCPWRATALWPRAGNSEMIDRMPTFRRRCPATLAHSSQRDSLRP